MVTKELSEVENRLYYRLVTLWVVCEAFAGGLMHAVKLPFTGMAINGLAVICIILIGIHIKTSGAILKATLIVIVFKFMLSPHSPPTAYIAVGFQGLLGSIILRRRVTQSGSMILGAVTLVESAMQRLLVLLIIYGNSFWKALNSYISKLTGEKEITNYSLIIAILYVFIHAVAGLFVGRYAFSLAARSSEWALAHPEHLFQAKEETQQQRLVPKPRGKKIKLFILICWLILAGFAYDSIAHPASALIGRSEVMGIIVRAGLIITSWSLIFSPLVKILIGKVLLIVKGKNKESVEAVSSLLPEIKFVFFESWRRSYSLKGFSRLKLCIKIMLANVLTAATPSNQDN